MPVAKRKARIQASEVEVGNRTLEAVLLDLAEQNRETAALVRETAEQVRETAEQARADRARYEEQRRADQVRLAALEAQSAMALQTIAAVHKDLVAITLEMREENRRTRERLTTLEQRSPGP